jgi:hypothetical protein
MIGFFCMAGTAIKITFDPRGLDIFDRALKTLGTKKVDQILHYSLDQVGKRLSTQVRKEIVKQTAIPRTEVDRNLRDIQSSSSRLIYTIEGISHHEPLSRSWFKPTQETGGVHATPWNQPRTFPNTFLERLGGWAFKRVGEHGRRMLWGPSVAVEMERDLVPIAFKAFADQILPLTIEKKLAQFIP